MYDLHLKDIVVCPRPKAYLFDKLGVLNIFPCWDFLYLPTKNVY